MLRKKRTRTSSSHNSRIKMSIPGAIDKQPVEIVDDADCQMESSITWIGASMHPLYEQNTIKITSLTCNDKLISHPSDHPSLYSKPCKYSSQSNADCKNLQNLERSSNVYSDSRRSSNTSKYVIKHIGRKRINKEYHRRNSWSLKLKTVDSISKVAGSPAVTSDLPAKISKSYKPYNPVSCHGRRTVKEKFQKSVNESENKLDLTQTYDSISSSCTDKTMTDLSILPSYTKDFELGNPKWRGPLHTAFANSQKKKDKDCPDKTSNIWKWMEPFSPDLPERTDLSTKVMLQNFAEDLGSGKTQDEKNSTPDTTAQYWNVDHFLAGALVDELYNKSASHEGSITQSNVSELISDESTQSQKTDKGNWKRTPITTMTASPQYKSTYSRTMRICKSVARKIKNILRPSAISSRPRTAKSDPAVTAWDLAFEDKDIQALMKEVKIQETIMYQANKGLTVCRSMKEFEGGTEQVELARLFLLAGLKKAAALSEIKKLRLTKREYYQQCYEKGDVTIKNFGIPLEENILKQQAQTGDFVEWFVVAVSQGPTVWATGAVSCPKESQRINITGGTTFPDVSPNFKIIVRIYSLKIRRKIFNQDDENCLNAADNEKYSRFPFPNRLILKKTDRPKSPKQVKQTERSTEAGNTFFDLLGVVELYLRDLSRGAPWPLRFLMPGSVLSGTIDLNLSCKLHLSVSHSGFVTRGYEPGSLVHWKRRWCVLEGEILKFWNYPCDQENKEPLATIDLTNCISKEITIADKSICASRARTLLIETARQRNRLDRNSMLMECHSSYTVVRNLLSCDSARDLAQWISKLNQVILALHDWNVTNRPPDVQDSDF